MTPFKGNNRVTSIFGWRTSPINGLRQHHNGIDSVATDGNWNVRECTGGTVIETSVGYNYGRGNLVRVQCGNAVETYQHLSSIAVKKGQTVKQGDTIGVAGKTGDSTGVHLHFEVTIGGKAVNPSEWCGIPNAIGVYPGNDNLDGSSDPVNPGAVEVGSIVSFQGGNVYASSEAAKAAASKGTSKCKVTGIAEGTKHPYHCISQDGKGVYGWVDAAAIGASVPDEQVTMYNLAIGPMTVGDKNALEAQAKKLGLSVAVTEVG